MAISVDNVYKTVLLILNKEQRGYVTPEEFNRIGTQVQREIFEEYIQDLAQQLRVPQNDNEYADRVKILEEKISPFKTSDDCTYNAAVGNVPGYFLGPTFTSVLAPNNSNPLTRIYKLGSVLYNDSTEAQRVNYNEYVELNNSNYTQPSTSFPIYLYEENVNQGNNKIIVYPQTIQNRIRISYIKIPSDIVWDYNEVANTGAYVYAPTDSVWFELDNNEQSNVITRVLLYMGIVIQDPQIIQIAAQQVQQEKINEKS